MRIFLFILLSVINTIAYGQFAIPEYNIVRDSLTHITVFHSGNSEKVRISKKEYSDTLAMISPDVRIKNGIIDHKSLTGEMLVREYYLDSALIGYIEFDGTDIQREIYFNSDGKAFLVKSYDKGVLTNTNDKVGTFFRKTSNP